MRSPLARRLFPSPPPVRRRLPQPTAAVESLEARRLLAAATVAEVEPNNTPATGQALAGVSTRVNGSLSTAADVDWYTVTLAAGERVTVNVRATTRGARGLDPQLTVLNPASTEIAADDDGGVGSRWAAGLTFTATTAGTYRIGVSSGDQNGTDTGAYALEVENAPSIELDGDGVLQIDGTDSNDTVRVRRRGDQVVVTVKILSHVETETFDLEEVESIRIDLRGGDDSATIAWRLRVDALILGGDGNDRIFSGLGSDVIIGGAGRDVLFGRGGGDLVTGGETDGLTDEDLDAIFAEWTSDKPADERIANLSDDDPDDDRENGDAFLIPGETLLDDGDTDSAVGFGFGLAPGFDRLFALFSDGEFPLDWVLRDERFEEPA